MEGEPVPNEADRLYVRDWRGPRPAAPPRRPRPPWRRVMALLGGAVGLAVGVLLAETFYGPPRRFDGDYTGEHAARACLDPAGHVPGFVRQVGERVGTTAPIQPVSTRLSPAEGGWLVTMRYRRAGQAADIASAQARLDPAFCLTMLME